VPGKAALRNERAAAPYIGADLGQQRAALARELAVLEGIAAAEWRAAPAWFFWWRAQWRRDQDPLLHMQHPMAKSSSCSCSCRAAFASLSIRRSSSMRALSLFSGGFSPFSGERKREFNSAFFGGGY
jgi:hypothetical protein